MKLGLVYNARQAKLFIGKKIQVDAYLSFCPEAKYYLDQAGKRVITTLELYGPALHARTAVITAKELERVVEQCKIFYQLSYAESRSLRVYLYYYLSTAYYVYYCLAKIDKGYTRFYWEDKGKIRHSDDFDDFLFKVVQQAASGVDSYSKTGYSYLSYRLAQRLNKKLVARAAKDSTVRLIDFVNPATRHIVRQLVSMDKSHVSFSLRWVGRNALRTYTIYRKICASLATNKDFNEPVPLFKAVHPQAYKRYASNIADIAIHNKRIRRIILDRIAYFVPVLRAEFAFGMEAIRLIDANVNIGDHAMYPFIRGATQQMYETYGENAITALVNHGTHNLQKTNRISDLVQRSWASQDRLLTEATKIFIPKSRLTLALAKSLSPDFTYQTRSVRIYEPVAPMPHNPGEDFVIVHAGNFTEVYTRIGWMHIPWCRETSFEYVSQILEFIDQIKDIEGIKLIVKLKPFKSDPHYTIINEHVEKLGIAHKVTLDSGITFTEIMKKSHLVVSNLSTVMEESIPNNIPTLLYTYRKRYFHFPCRFEPPREGNTGLIYGVKRKEDLAPMIEAIIKNHKHLLEQNNSDIAWQKNDLIEAKDFALELVSLAQQVKPSSQRYERDDNDGTHQGLHRIR